MKRVQPLATAFKLTPKNAHCHGDLTELGLQHKILLMQIVLVNNNQPNCTQAPSCVADPANAGRFGPALLTLSGVLAFALLAPVAGVALSTWLLALLALYAAGNRWLPAALIACGLTLLLLALFVLGLQVPFQIGRAHV